MSFAARRKGKALSALHTYRPINRHLERVLRLNLAFARRFLRL